MHATVERWTAAVVDRYHLRSRSVLEIGAGGDNGSRPGLRGLFDGSYVGLDREATPGLLMHDAEHPLPVTNVGVVLCTEVLEHTLRPWVVVTNVADALEPGGYAIFTARGYDEDGCAPVHMMPHDYWRFSVASIRSMMEDAGLAVTECVRDPDPLWRGVLAVGRNA